MALALGQFSCSSSVRNISLFTLLSFVLFGHPVVIYIIVYNIAFSVLGYVQDSLMSHSSSSMAMPLG